jgi:hypothetical protein
MRGATHLLAASILTLSAALILLIVQAVVAGPKPAPIVQFALLIGLVLAMYRGAQWARWSVGLLAGLSGLLALVGVAALAQVDPPVALLFVLVAFAHLVASVLLWTSPALRDYVASRRPSARA